MDNLLRYELTDEQAAVAAKINDILRTEFDDPQARIAVSLDVACMQTARHGKPKLVPALIERMKHWIDVRTVLYFERRLRVEPSAREPQEGRRVN